VIAFGLETTFMRLNNYHSDYVSDFYLPVFPNLLTFFNLYLYQNFIDYLHITLPTLANYYSLSI